VDFAALVTWCGTVLLGLYMMTVWLIEYDPAGRGETASQLPPVVVFSHLTLALSGLVVWGIYLLTDQQRLAWIAVAMLTVIGLLGLLMFARWIPAYHSQDRPVTSRQFPGDQRPVPPESHIPQAVVACHGVLAGTTYVLALLSALNIGGS
jgi:manganese efflux pump family protein